MNMEGVQATNDGPAQVDQMNAFNKSLQQQNSCLQQSLGNMEEQLKLITEQLTAMGERAARAEEELKRLRKINEKSTFEAGKNKKVEGGSCGGPHK